MSTADLIVNIVLAAFVIAGVVGLLAWSIVQGHKASVGPLRPVQTRGDISAAAENVGGQYSGNRGLAVG